MDCDLGDAADANSPPRDNGSATNSELFLHVKVFALAEKNAIGPLKARSVSKFEVNGRATVVVM